MQLYIALHEAQATAQHVVSSPLAPRPRPPTCPPWPPRPTASAWRNDWRAVSTSALPPPPAFGQQQQAAAPTRWRASGASTTTFPLCVCRAALPLTDCLQNVAQLFTLPGNTQHRRASPSCLTTSCRPAAPLTALCHGSCVDPRAAAQTSPTAQPSPQRWNSRSRRCRSAGAPPLCASSAPGGSMSRAQRYDACASAGWPLSASQREFWLLPAAAQAGRSDAALAKRCLPSCAACGAGAGAASTRRGMWRRSVFRGMPRAGKQASAVQQQQGRIEVQWRVWQYRAAAAM